MDTYNAVLTNTANNFRDWTEYFSFNVWKKNQSKSLSPNFSNGHLECKFHNSAKTILTEAELSSAYWTNLYKNWKSSKKFFRSNCSHEHVNGSFDQTAAIFIPNWKIFLSTSIFFSSKFFLRHVVCNIV